MSLSASEEDESLKIMEFFFPNGTRITLKTSHFTGEGKWDVTE